MPTPARLSEHFTLAELTATEHREFQIEQAGPDDEVLSNLLHLCHTLLEPARAMLGALHVNSGWRCPGLNAAVGGSKTSRHLAGLAADVVPLELDLQEAYLELTQSTLPFDQLIFERPGGHGWIHIGACAPDLEPRLQMLAMYRPGAYELWDPNDPRFLRAA